MNLFTAPITKKTELIYIFIYKKRGGKFCHHTHRKELPTYENRLFKI